MHKIGFTVLGALWASTALAEQSWDNTGQVTALSYTVWGTPGLIEMPTAESAPDAELAFTGAFLGPGDANHYTLTFQITPRLSGSFRYSRINQEPIRDEYTRSFDIRYRFIDEGDLNPAIALGLQDFVGTGQYSGEYFVATKHFTPKLSFTGGVGWGRYGSYHGVRNPLGFLDSRFKDRPSDTFALGGKVESKKWFRGDMGFFGGIAWKPTDKLVLKAEYSSDDKAYERHPDRNHFKHKSPFNFGVDYQINKSLSLQGFYLYGDQVGLAATLKINPRDHSVTGDITTAPVPVKPRDPAQINEMAWAEDPQNLDKLRATLTQVLGPEGVGVDAVDFDPRIVTIRIRNRRYISGPELIGRTARIMTQVLPASVEVFRIVPVSNGIPISAVSLKRGDLEQLENDPDGSWRSYVRASIKDFPYYPTPGTLNPDLYPRFSWGFGPDLTFSYFDPKNPLRYEVTANATAQYNPLPGLYFNAEVAQLLFGTKSKVRSISDSVLPHVRSDTYLYDKEKSPRLYELTGSYYFRPGNNLYGRVTAGYLERMFGGASAELLWMPVNSRLALGIETNYVWQRDFNQRFGFQHYNVASGHVSAYYQLDYGFNVELDAGRYLAKDWGGTLTVTREFANGWVVGVFATKTDVSSERFGEGSFDKGIILSVPLDKIFGRSTRQSYSTVIRPLTRDGGARLNVPGRLYEQVKQYHQPFLKEQWGKFWR